MEEILASIRRIISEDDTSAAAPKVEAPPPEPPPPPPPPPVAEVRPPPLTVETEEEDDDVLELTEPVHGPSPAETHGDLDVFAPQPEPAKAPEAPVSAPPKPVAAPVYVEDDEPLVSGGSEDKVASHFGLLSQTIAMPPAGLTLDDVVRQMLRPLLKAWLDEHLPTIVEEKVQAEVERIARRRV